MGLFATLSINDTEDNDILMTLSIVCHYAECRDYLKVMLSVIMLNVSMFSIVTLNVVMLSVVLLNVVMLSVVLLNVVMLSVVAPFLECPSCSKRVNEILKHFVFWICFKI